MPNLDGGHYFLTVLAPIRTDTLADPISSGSRSHEHVLAHELALLPTGRQTAASPQDAPKSPFARNTLNHLARFVIIDGPAFNGRVSEDSLVALIRKINPLTPQKVDGLGTPYLLFAADIDAHAATTPEEGEAALAAYLAKLWETMAAELSRIFGHCIGFTGGSAEAFHDYIKRCQIETTMPFNDYWPEKLQAEAWVLPTKPLIVSAGLAVLALVAWLVALLLNGAFGVSGRHHVLAAIAAWGLLVVPVLIAATGLCAFLLYRQVMARGRLPFPTSPGSSLDTVLKSLYLQKQLSDFAIAAQALDDAGLHARFGEFLDLVRPGEAVPTQAAGEIST